MKAAFFFDAQNILSSMRKVYGALNEKIMQPDFDPIKLIDLVMARFEWNDWSMSFYTGIPGDFLTNPQELAGKGKPVLPEHEERAEYYRKCKLFWIRRGAHIGRWGDFITRFLTIHDHKFSCPSCHHDGFVETVHECGIDVLIGIDVYYEAVSGDADAIVIFSLDRDFHAAIARAKKHMDPARKVKFYCAYIETSRSRGISDCIAIPISTDEFDQCRDKDAWE